MGESLPNGAISFTELMNQKCDIENAEPLEFEDTIFMPYSSGTTGLPKGVNLSNKNIVSNLCQIMSPETTISIPTTESHQDIVPAVLPMFHIYGFVCSLGCLLYNGSKVIALPKFTPELYINTLKNHKPHFLFTVPPIVIFLTHHPDVKPELFDSIRGVTSGAAPLGAEDEERFIKKVNRPIQITQGYGLSETSPVVTMVAPKKPKSLGSIGEPVPNTFIKVVDTNDPTATHLGPNKLGEILVKGPQVMKSYHNRPEESANAFVDGYFRTGDMGYYTDQKHFFITERIKELIKVKGFQVAPAELEEIIRGFDGVGDCAVIGVPHELYGEVPRAYIVPKAQTKIDCNKLNSYVSSKVAQYKQLKGGIAVTDSIPKNASGKILRRQLKLQFAEEQ